MKNIIIGFCRPKKFMIGSFLIRLVEGVEYSHVYMVVDGDVYQESLPGINTELYSVFLDSHKVIEEFVVCVSDEQHADIMKFCSECLIKKIPYGKMQIVGMGFIRMANQLFRSRFKNPFADGMKTLVCSEFVGVILNMIGCTIPSDQLEIEGPKLILKTVQRFTQYK